VTVGTNPLRLTLSCDGPDPEGFVDVRLTVFNASAEPVALDRRLLYGPHPGHGDMVMLASEPAALKASKHSVLLNPHCFYGRQRRYQYPGGEMTFHGYLVTERTDGLLPAGPTERKKLAAGAEPLVVRFSRG
jgi:hypothetical protein